MSFGFYVVRIIFPEIIYTGVITIFAYVFVYFINRKLILLEKRRRFTMRLKAITQFLKDLGSGLKHFLHRG